MNQGLVAILVITATIAGVLAGARIQARKDARGRAVAPVRGRELWVPASLLALSVTFTAMVLWTAVALLIEVGRRDRDFVRRPLAEIRVTPSQSGSVEDRWRGPRGSAGAPLSVLSVSAGDRGEDGAIQVPVDFPARGETEVAQVLGGDLREGVAVATVWVYVPSFGHAQEARLHARLVGRMNAGSNGRFSLVGDRTPLKPGGWTQVVWTGSYALELSPTLAGDSAGDKKVRASERLASLAVRLETDKAYSGFVFVDDLRLYAAEASPPAGPR